MRRSLVSGSITFSEACCSSRLLEPCCHGYNNKLLHKLHCPRYCAFSCSHGTASKKAGVCPVLQVPGVEMPISSGAVGRVDAGVGSSATWTQDGLKRETKPVSSSCDSYLQRYLETIEQRKLKSNSSEDDHLPPEDLITGAKSRSMQKTGDSKHDTTEKPSCEKRSKKSRMCIIL